MQESHANPNAVSKSGARGLMQLMPATARELGEPDNPGWQSQIVGGAKYLGEMLKRYKGNVALSLAAYNAGPGAVDKAGGIPPIAETQAYVRNILANAYGVK